MAYTPSITQAVRTREQLKGRWIDARTIEVLHRGWYIEGQAVRPDHRMVAHTAFLTVARFLGVGAGRQNDQAQNDQAPNDQAQNETDPVETAAAFPSGSESD